MKTGVIALIGIFVLLYLVPLGIRPLAAPDETRYGEISREMLASGDWVVPRLNGLRYFEKPILGHWLNAVSLQVFGDNAFAIRLPSAFAAGLAGMLLFFWARRYSAEPLVPLFAAAVFLLSFLVFGIGTFAVLDSMLALFTTAAVVAFSFAYQEPSLRRQLLFLFLAGAACGGAFLTKGFIALVIPVSVVLPFAGWQRQLGLCLRTCWMPMVGAVLVSLPWSLMIHGREPDFWHYFFWVEHVNRFISPAGGQHPEPVWYYLPVLIGGIMPWTVLAGTFIPGLRKTGLHHPMIRFALCWLVFPFLFFSACGGKLATYILPCFPPAAFLIAVGVVAGLRAGRIKGFVVGAGIMVALAGALLIALVVVLVLTPRLKVNIPLWQGTVVAVGLIGWGWLARLAIIAPTIGRRLVLFSAAPILVMFSVPLIANAPLKPSKVPGAFLVSQATNIPPGGIIVSRTALAASVCWYYQRNDVILFANKGEYDYGLGYADAQTRFVDIEGFQRLLGKPAPGGVVTLVSTTKEYNPIMGDLPVPVRKEVFGDLVLLQFATPQIRTEYSGPTSLSPTDDSVSKQPPGAPQN